MNKSFHLSILCVFLIFFVSLGGCKEKVNYLNVTSLNPGSTFVVRNWYVLPEKKYAKVLVDARNDSDYLTFKDLFKGKDHLFTYQNNDFLNLSAILKIDTPGSCYAYCYINSDEERSVAFTTGIGNDGKIWVNDSLCLAGHASNITKHEFVFKADLKKGNNFVAVKISNDTNVLGFHLDIVSPGTVNKYWYGRNFYSISKHYLIPLGTNFDVVIQNACYDTMQPARIQILDSKKNTLIETKVDKGKSWSMDLHSLKPGAYQCKLITKEIQYEQPFIYGDYKAILADLTKDLSQLNANQDIKLNVGTLLSRIGYLNDFGQKNGYDQVLERKMSGILFELERIKDSIRQKKDPFINSVGYHIMSYRSDIDGTTNHYAVFIPNDLDSLNNIPIIMILPWVAKQNPFIESWHLAFIDRIEFLEHLAQKYKCAIMWQSARVYEKYNFNPIVNSAIAESLQDLQKYYKIDPNRIYAYGTCSGGTQALLLACRHPSLFAAAGVEGPEISYLAGNKFPRSWVQQNNIITSAQNYANLPLYIANSTNDWHGGKQPELGNFINSVKSTGGDLTFGSMGDPTVTEVIKMRDDNQVTDKIFGFLTQKTRAIPSRIKLSIARLKYNKSFWISIDGIIADTLATIDARIDAGKISLMAQNVSSFTIYPNDLPKNTCSQFAIYLNNRHLQTINIDPSKSKYTFQVGPSEGKILKDHFAEGPINDFFANKFYLIKRSDTIHSASIDSFLTNWRYNFFGTCYNKEERQLSYQELSNSNILFFGNSSSNKYIKQMLDSIPLRVFGDTISIFGRKWTGKHLTVKMIYPNPLNNKKYFLVIAGTNNYINPRSVIDLPLKGWTDLEIIKDSSKKIYAGDFNQHWKLL